MRSTLSSEGSKLISPWAAIRATTTDWTPEKFEDSPIYCRFASKYSLLVIYRREYLRKQDPHWKIRAKIAFSQKFKHIRSIFGQFSFFKYILLTLSRRFTLETLFNSRIIQKKINSNLQLWTDSFRCTGRTRRTSCPRSTPRISRGCPPENEK